MYRCAGGPGACQCGCTIDPDDESRCGVDVVERLRSASSVNDVMRWLLVLSRVPFEEILQFKDFAAFVHVMLRYEDVAEIQSRGCTVLLLPSQYVDSGSYTDAIISVYKAGGHRAILKVMKKHPYDTKLQGCSCNALIGQASLRRQDGRLVAHVAHTSIIGAMLRHQDDYSVQKGGCGVLLHLLMGHPEDKKALVVVGAARVVATASEKFWGCLWR
jgi:hypothetical protein